MTISDRTAARAFVVLTALYVLPAFGFFNDLQILGIALNVIYLATLLLLYVVLAAAWYFSSSKPMETTTFEPELDQ